jgi:hypothetical protein
LEAHTSILRVLSLGFSETTWARRIVPPGGPFLIKTLVAGILAVVMAVPVARRPIGLGDDVPAAALAAPQPQGSQE